LIHTGVAVRNPLRAISRVETGTQNKWNGVSVGNVTTAWKGEGSAFTDGSPTLGNPSVTAAMLTAYVTASYEVFQDSNLQSQLTSVIAESIDFAESAAFISGSGSGAPKGIVTAVSGTAGSLVTATTRGAFTSASVADVFAVVNAAAVRYEDSSSWVMNKATANTIRQIANPTAAGQLLPVGATELLGSPLYHSSTMATAQTSGTILAILGDFSQFVIYDRLGVNVEYIPNVVDGSGVPTGQRGLVAYKRCGSDVTDVDAFRLLKT
jgi:HK97 family phage major capsid protein